MQTLNIILTVVATIADGAMIYFVVTALVIATWQRSVRTLILENRWPEEEYISDVKFMED